MGLRFKGVFYIMNAILKQKRIGASFLTSSSLPVLPFFLLIISRYLVENQLDDGSYFPNICHFAFPDTNQRALRKIMQGGCMDNYSLRMKEKGSNQSSCEYTHLRLYQSHLFLPFHRRYCPSPYSDTLQNWQSKTMNKSSLNPPINRIYPRRYYYPFYYHMEMNDVHSLYLLRKGLEVYEKPTKSTKVEMLMGLKGLEDRNILQVGCSS